MPTAHEDNGGIQVFSRTQTAEQIEAALGGQGYGEFESETYSTAPAARPAPPVELDENGQPKAPPVDPAAAVPPAVDARPPRPGRRERQLGKVTAEFQAYREKTEREMGELRGMIMGRNGAPPQDAAPPVAAPAAAPKLEVVEPPPLEIAKFDKPRPKREDFFDAADPEMAYEDAVADHRLEAREFERTARTAAEQRQQEQVKGQTIQLTAKQRFEQSLTEARTEFPDFQEALDRPHFDRDNKPLTVVSNAMTHVIQNRKNGAKILYWLAKHPEKAAEIASKTIIADSRDTWAVQEAMDLVGDEFKLIEADLAANPPVKAAPPAAAPASAAEVIDDEYDDETDEDELAVDPNLQPVGSEPAKGRKVEQGPAPGTVDTKPPAGQQPPPAVVAPKPDPVSRVGQRGGGVNRRLLDTPPEVLRVTQPSDYRAKRALEGSTAARG